VIEYFLMAFFVVSPKVAAAAGGGGAPNAGAPAPKAVAPAAFKRPVEITADRLEIAGKRNEAIWSGHVRAKRGPTKLKCDRLIAHYSNAQEITRIECIGGVEVEDGDRWAKGERADFDNVAGVLVVTGSPEARQGPNHMRGTKVTFRVEQDTLEVENAQAIFETSKGMPAIGGGKAPATAPPKKKATP
jgi:lipopolysaccharide export system protein LptA